MNLFGKTILITGGLRGLGFSLATSFAKRGANLILTYNKSKSLIESTTSKLIKFNVNVEVIKCNLEREKDIINLYNYLARSNQKIDVLVNNAAISMDNYLLEKSQKEFQKILSVNLIAPFLLVKHGVSYLNKQAYVVNIASTDGIDTFNEYNIDYSASKAALINLTKNLAYSLKDYNFILIAPNFINTESTLSMNQDFLASELKRIGQKDLIDKTILSEKIVKMIENNSKSGTFERIDGNE